MGGPTLEVVKFGFYLFFPIFTMVKFGDPEWYETYVAPYRDRFWPDYETTHGVLSEDKASPLYPHFSAHAQRPPKTASEVQAELARMKAARQARRMPSASAEVPANSTNESAAGDAMPVVANETYPTSHAAPTSGSVSGSTILDALASGSTSQPADTTYESRGPADQSRSSTTSWGWSQDTDRRLV